MSHEGCAESRTGLEGEQATRLRPRFTSGRQHLQGTPASLSITRGGGAAPDGIAERYDTDPGSTLGRMGPRWLGTKLVAKPRLREFQTVRSLTSWPAYATMDQPISPSRLSDVPGGHVCCLYETDEDRRRTLTHFVSEGLARGERVVCALATGDDRLLVGDLGNAGVDAAPMIESGQLVMIESETAYTRNGSFQVLEGLGRIEALLKEGSEEGYPAVRTVGDLRWLSRVPDAQEAFFEYESEVNSLLSHYGSSALCMHRRSDLSTGAQLRCLSVHSVTLVGDEVIRNPYVMTPDQGRRREPIDTSLEWRRQVADEIEETKRVRDLLQKVLESVEAAVLVVDREGRAITECNAAAEAMFGYPREELIGMETRSLHVDETNWKEFGVVSGRVLDAGVPYHGDFRMRRSDGSTFPTRHVVTLLDPGGGGVVSTVRDMSDEVEARRRGSESSARFGAIAESISDAVLTVDAGNRIVYANSAAHRMMGVEDGTLSGRSMTDMMPEDLQDRHRVGMNRYLQTGEKRMDWSRVLMPVRRADGTTFDAEISFGEYMIRGERFFTGVIRDSTERLRLESELRQSQKMEAVGRLASGVAHDFNNLLTLIRGSSELIRMDLPEDSPLHDEVTGVLDGVERASALTRQLLVLSRSQVLDERIVDLTELVAGMKPLLKRVVPSRIKVVVDSDPGPFRVRGDPNELHRVVLNLAMNAADAIEGNGTIRLAVSTAGDPGGKLVQLEVADTGSGIPPEAMEQIFDPFFTTKPEGRGTGLGLSSAQGIVKQMGGQIYVESTVGVGTTFRMVLPVAEPGPSKGPVAAPKVADRRDAIDAGPLRTVLVVEDDPTLARVLVRSLERAGFRVLSASNGEEAVERAEADQIGIDLVLSDVVMPGPRGPELLRRLRLNDPNVKMVMMSGHSSGELAGQLDGDIEAFLAKPFSPREMVEAIRDALDPPTSSARPPD
ncbi:MAG: PAS domain S-box protein [Gemmatimonadales bacterium]|nr:MAG: PAS domain S-box protein [Gemmatimonadales bacterium]